jgi:mono/diheme cytochrome c family protein
LTPSQKITRLIIGCGLIVGLLGGLVFFSIGHEWMLSNKQSGGKEERENGAFRQAIQETFRAHCSTCHGSEGDGNGATARLLRLKMRNFKDCRSMLQFTDEVLFSIIKNGAASLGRSAAMPGWSQTLSDGEIKEMVRYIRSLCNADKR